MTLHPKPPVVPAVKHDYAPVLVLVEPGVQKVVLGVKVQNWVWMVAASPALVHEAEAKHYLLYAVKVLVAYVVV